ncbi:MAG: hypothetical protein OEY17_06705 [Nitrosopumilus sp.]|nr:hypothetical protein [Nitrosopumilus sp.]MDH5659014.1 hypothetical protein [Nitrosopumilus sp.]
MANHVHNINIVVIGLVSFLILFSFVETYETRKTYLDRISISKKLLEKFSEEQIKRIQKVIKIQKINE